MPKTYRTTEEIVRIYRLSQSGKTVSEVALELGIPYSGVSSALKHLKKYLTGKAREQDRQSRNYREVVRQLRKEKRTEARQPEHAVQPTDNLAALKESFSVFQRAITTFIERDVKSRHSALLEENEKLRAQVENLQKDMERLRSNNWIDQLALGIEEEKV
jgi:hypothetical protein